MVPATSFPRLLAIGGAEDKEGERAILREFVRLAGGQGACIVIIPSASETPEVVGELYQHIFQQLGASEVTVLTIAARDDARDEAAMRQIERATGTFFTGGDQLRIMNRLGGTGVDTMLHRRCAEGMVVGGTSAGAAVMSSTMIVEGETRSPRAGAVRTGPGLELLPGVIIDQHFAQRGRIGRLLSVIGLFPHYLGVGIDEDTAIAVEGHRASVIGSGAVTIVDAGCASFNDAVDTGPGGCITLSGVTLHSLPHGRSFDLLERRPIIAAD
ncbi:MULTISPECIES: cyanophycinase [Sorangium]|uniref:Cyanophycinase n=1 Tax=Sorangium cellulosum TaxID=56 RepID=A0A4P2R189_SORCE|nr:MULTISPECIES: cyanophycinase [Sorangium]AUX36408.1 cyanophycinase [Sorangium cellulosum]WCQ95705.1 Cyanophycinase [Sorangium sp. Soce836]